MAFKYLYLLIMVVCSEDSFTYPEPDINVCSAAGTYSYDKKTNRHSCRFRLYGIDHTDVKKVCSKPPGYHQNLIMGFNLNKNSYIYCPVTKNTGWKLKKPYFCYLLPHYQPRKGIEMKMDCDITDFNEIGYSWPGFSKHWPNELKGKRNTCDAHCNHLSDPKYDLYRGCTCNTKLNETNCADFEEKCKYYLENKISVSMFHFMKFSSENKSIALKIFLAILVCFLVCFCVSTVCCNIELPEENFYAIDDFMREKVCFCCRKCFFNYRENRKRD
ncbi:hypothetical protein MHBO_001688 [Bonamia ostreae]|uniref:Uncharacterized protein n=1 Tax=Bonamia ostreae TaxID=126728 RepID=A0ABV2AJU1_9EUKA